MAIDKQRVRQHFNRHAHEYDRHALVQERMADQLIELLVAHAEHAATPVRTVLEIGCGTGRLTERLLQVFPNAEVTALDLCENMIDQATHRLAASRVAGRQIRWIVADAEQWPLSSASDKFDLIISNATFQWFNQVEQTMAAYVARLSAEGTLAFATFLPNTFCEMHDAFVRAADKQGIPRTRYGQTFLAAEQWRAMLEKSGGQWQWREQQYLLYYDTVRAFLDSVKRVGAGNAIAQTSDESQEQNNGETRFGRYPGKQLLQEMMSEYERHHGGCDEHGRNKVKVTYEVGFGLMTGGMGE